MVLTVLLVHTYQRLVFVCVSFLLGGPGAIYSLAATNCNVFSNGSVLHSQYQLSGIKCCRGYGNYVGSTDSSLLVWYVRCPLVGRDGRHYANGR